MASRSLYGLLPLAYSFGDVLGRASTAEGWLMLSTAKALQLWMAGCAEGMLVRRSVRSGLGATKFVPAPHTVLGLIRVGFVSQSVPASIVECHNAVSELCPSKESLSAGQVYQRRTVTPFALFLHHLHPGKLVSNACAWMVGGREHKGEFGEARRGRSRGRSAVEEGARAR